MSCITGCKSLFVLKFEENERIHETALVTTHFSFSLLNSNKEKMLILTLALGVILVMNLL